jgi:hypothetical protein
MAPQGIRRFIFAGVMAAAALPLVAAQKSPAPAPVVEPSPVSQTPPENATHEQFVTWLRTTDLGKMLRRDSSAYTIERTKNGTIMRLNGPAFREVLFMALPVEAKVGESLPTCIGTLDEAEAMMKKAEVPAEKP